MWDFVHISIEHFMRLIKKILFPLFSIFLIYRTIDLVNNLLAMDISEFSFMESIFVAFLLNIFITGIFAFPGFAFSTNRILPSNYYAINNKQVLLNFYNIFGIDIFRKALLFFFWGLKKNRKIYFNGTKGGLENFIHKSKQSEFGNLSSFTLILLISIALLIKGYILLVAITIIINVLCDHKKR